MSGEARMYAAGKREGIEACLRLLRDCSDPAQSLGGSGYRTPMRLLIKGLYPYEEQEAALERFGLGREEAK